jgi:hypothetical protein
VLPTFGNRIVRSTSNGTISITVGPSLAEAGLLDHGAQLWFSFLCPHPNNINVSPNLVFGNDSLSSTTSVSNSGNAIGVRINQGTTVQAITCVGGGIVATSASQATLANSELALIVGKITWGATPAAVDTIQIYTPGTNLALDTPQSATAVLDQSTFNVISSWGNGNTPNIDEIRFGATYADVIGQGIDTSGDITAPTLDHVIRHSTHCGFGFLDHHDRHHRQRCEWRSIPLPQHHAKYIQPVAGQSYIHRHRTHRHH